MMNTKVRHNISQAPWEHNGDLFVARFAMDTWYRAARALCFPHRSRKSFSGTTKLSRDASNVKQIIPKIYVQIFTAYVLFGSLSHNIILTS